MITRVEELKAVLRTMGYQFRLEGPGRIQHRYAGTGSESPAAAGLVAELKELVWIEHVCNEAGSVFEAWVMACYQLGEILGFPALALGDGRGTIAKGREGWGRWLCVASLQEARSVTEQLRQRVEEMGSPRQLGMELAEVGR